MAQSLILSAVIVWIEAVSDDDDIGIAPEAAGIILTEDAGLLANSRLSIAVHVQGFAVEHAAQLRHGGRVLEAGLANDEHAVLVQRIDQLLLVRGRQVVQVSARRHLDLGPQQSVEPRSGRQWDHFDVRSSLRFFHVRHDERWKRGWFAMFCAISLSKIHVRAGKLLISDEMVGPTLGLINDGTRRIPQDLQILQDLPCQAKEPDFRV